MSSIDQAFTVSLFARLAAAETKQTAKHVRLSDKAQDQLAGIEKILSQLAVPAGKSTIVEIPGTAHPHEQALILYVLSDALLSLEQLERESRNPKPAQDTIAAIKAKLQSICLLRYYGAIQEQQEPGGLWQDPIDSFLYLSSAKRLETAGAFRGFRSQKKLGAAQKQNETASLPSAVMNLPIGDILAWTKTQEQNTAGEKAQTKKTISRKNEMQLWKKMASLIWERNQYLDFSRELTRYLVDDAGAAKGNSIILGAEGFLGVW